MASERKYLLDECGEALTRVKAVTEAEARMTPEELQKARLRNADVADAYLKAASAKGILMYPVKLPEPVKTVGEAPRWISNPELAGSSRPR
jgi:hypothetical protein